MSASPARATPPPRKLESDQEWVVRAWKERGLITPTADVSRAELAAMHSSSWFVRRNRRYRHQEAQDPVIVPDTMPAGSWLTRRNKRSGRRRHSAQLPVKHFLSVIQSRLPTSVQPASPSSPVLASSYESSPSSSRPAETPTPERPERRPEVHLTLYDLCSCCNCVSHHVGLGVYHSGIELDGLEYTFDHYAGGGSGVVAHEPYYTDESRSRSLPVRGKLLLGRSRLPSAASHQLLRSLSESSWPSESYDLLERNCHHWVIEASRALGVDVPPPWISRASDLMRFFSGAPTGGESGPRAARATATAGGADGAARRGAAGARRPPSGEMHRLGKGRPGGRLDGVIGGVVLPDHFPDADGGLSAASPRVSGRGDEEPLLQRDDSVGW